MDYPLNARAWDYHFQTEVVRTNLALFSRLWGDLPVVSLGGSLVVGLSPCQPLFLGTLPHGHVQIIANTKKLEKNQTEFKLPIFR